MDLGDLNKVWEIKPLKKVGEDDVRNILEKIAKQVQPIMRQHKWRVKVLSEFCPQNPSLLGLNVGGGVQVKLRIRKPNRDWDFLRYDQILDTMLHELCHNAHGPHNANFYKLWDEIRKECEELMAKGISGTGKGFDLPGKHLGSVCNHPPITSLRKTALMAAEKRARLGNLLPAGPKRLGGDTTIRDALTPIQAAAMAAERRLQDDIWCGSSNLSSEDSLDVISRKRGRGTDSSSSHKSFDSFPKSKFVDLSMSPSSTRSSFVDLTIDSSVSRSVLKQEATYNDTEEAVTWECKACTLLNAPLAPICKVCSSEKPKDNATKYNLWTCKFCTLENNVHMEKCLACAQWRYSLGSPVATRAPNHGT